MKARTNYVLFYGTDAERVSFTPVQKYSIYYTTDTDKYYIFNGTTWKLINTSGGTGGMEEHGNEYHNPDFATLAQVYPVGSIYLSVNATNPASLFGGTWVSFGAGKMLVGLNTSDPDFDTVEETGGAKTHNHAVGTLAASAHADAGVADHTNINVPASLTTAVKVGTSTANAAAKTHNHTIASIPHVVIQPSAHTISGNTAEGNNLPPYITVYMWKRTA